MKKSLLVVTALTVAFAGSSACATKGFVQNQVGQVSSKVDSMGQSLEQTQERTRQNEQRIGEVDTKAGNAMTAANSANTAAAAADAKAAAAGESARTASTRLEEFDRANRRLMLEVVFNENAGGFAFGRAELSDALKAQIDQLVTQLKADPKNAYFEIEGHTDNVGDALYNEKIGQDRADAVKKYLHEQHQIPLHRVNTVSYGEAKPASDNRTSAGRAENRRVVIRVIA